MRLHDLSITAFGPFVDTVHVDFDELAAGGLFLLTGDTGAGKTSVLDAVCFALYGEVPGDRHTARHLRSDHAAPARRATGACSSSASASAPSGSPAPRLGPAPKRRGSGRDRVQAHVRRRGAPRRRLGRAHQPARRGRPPGHRACSG